MLIRLKDHIKNFVYRIIPPPYVNETFSQSGEDCCIDYLFSQLKITQPTYLELGVYKPKSASNTYLFYKRGCKGVLVEADKALIAEIKKIRPRDLVLNVGVGTENSESDLYIFEEPAHNTFIESEAEYRIKNGSYKFIKKEKVSIYGINYLISTNFETYPHLLSIDIEGLDYDVLKNLDIEKYPIPIICAETCTYSETHIKPKNKMIEALMISKGYFAYADTYINTIFVNDKWFKSIQNTI